MVDDHGLSPEGVDEAVTLQASLFVTIKLLTLQRSVGLFMRSRGWVEERHSTVEIWKLLRRRYERVFIGRFEWGELVWAMLKIGWMEKDPVRGWQHRTSSKRIKKCLESFATCLQRVKNKKYGMCDRRGKSEWLTLLVFYISKPYYTIGSGTASSIYTSCNLQEAHLGVTYWQSTLHAL